MKILQINISSNWGSTGHITEDISNLIIKESYESYVAYGRSINPGLSKTIKIGSSKDIYTHFIESRFFDNQGLASKMATRQFIRKVEKIRPDLIHLHNIHGYYLNYPILFKYLKEIEIPVIWTLHDCWAYTGHCSHYSLAGCTKWQTGCFKCPLKKAYPTSWIMDRSRRNYKLKKECFSGLKNLTLVPVSSWLCGEVKKSFLKDYPIQVINNGIDVDIFSPQDCNKKDLGLSDKFMVLGVASVWAEEKGLNDFFELRKSVGKDVQIVLIGLSHKQINNLPDGIIGIERTNDVKELAQYYSVSDVFFNSSKEETFGLTTAEAMACGTPAIVYKSTACPEIVSKETGFVINLGDIASIGEIISTIKENGKSSFSRKCRERVVHFFNKNDKYADYIKLYHKVLNK